MKQSGELNALQIVITAAVNEQLSTIPYFPAQEGARAAVVAALRGFVRTPREMQWLAETAMNHIRKWPGVGELRALYATTYKLERRPGEPEPICTIPGYTPADCETRYLNRISAHVRLLPAANEVCDPEVEAKLQRGMKELEDRMRMKRVARAGGIAKPYAAPGWLKDVVG